MPEDTLLHYSIEPATIDYSGGKDRLSIVRLTLRGENRTGAVIVVPRITVWLPNDRIDRNDTLTTDPTTVTAGPGPGTPWAVFPAGDGFCYAAPLPPAVGVAAGETVELVLGDIVVNAMPGAVRIGVTETADRDRSTTVEVRKDKLVPPGGDVPVIEEFHAEPAEIAEGATATLSWKVRNASRCLLDPGPVELPSPSSGQLSIPVHATTNFRLTALGPGGRADASSPVSLMPVRIVRFGAEPPNPATPGQLVVLEWETEFTSSVSIAPNLGPQPASGTLNVFPASTTTYTLTANGLRQRLEAVLVTVGP